MGNCATCCGKADGNEISTEKTVTRGAKGVQQENFGNGNDIAAAYPASGKFADFKTFKINFSFLSDFFHIADYDNPFNPDNLEINNEAYNNPGVMVTLILIILYAGHS